MIQTNRGVIRCQTMVSLRLRDRVVCNNNHHLNDLEWVILVVRRDSSNILHNIRGSNVAAHQDTCHDLDIHHRIRML